MDVAENRSAFDTAALKAEIYVMVYKFYGLTPEKIKIVDPASAVVPKAMADGSREASSFAEASPCAKPLRQDKSADKTQGKGETA